MKWSCVLVVSFLLPASVAGAQSPPRVRPIDTIAAMAFSRGAERSLRFRALVEELDASDVIVHVVTRPSLPFGLVGATRFVARLGDTRYVRVELAAHAAPDLRVATLAHELQHACEMARSSAGSHAEMRVLYHAIGHSVSSTHDAFETEAARVAGAEVWGELRGGRRTARAGAPRNAGAQASVGESGGNTRGSTPMK